MPTSPGPRPQLNQTHSSGWGWPHLVDVKQQKEKASQVNKQAKPIPKHVSAGRAAPPQRDLAMSSDLSTLIEEQSTAASPNHSPGSPWENPSGHRSETSENANAVDDQPEVIDTGPADEPLLRDESQVPEAQNADHGEQSVGERAVEGVDKDAEHPDESLPGAFPETPMPLETPGDRFPDLAQAGLLPTGKESNTTSPESQYPGLAQAGLLPTKNEPGTTSLDGQYPGLAQVGLLPTEKKSETTSPDSQYPDLAQDDLLPTIDQTLEGRTAEPKKSLTLSKKDRQVSISEPHKPLSIPKITVQHPTNSELSETGDDESPAQSSPTLNPRTIDSVLAEERRVSENRSLKERLDQERLVTSQLTQDDRERIVQDIATDMAAKPANVTEKQGIIVPEDVKTRMKFRRAVVRGPVLKLLLGRQLAGPTKEILKMRALGQPIVLGEISGLPTMAADGSTDIPHLSFMEMGPSQRFEFPPPQKRLAGHFTASDSYSSFSQPETLESQQVWYGGGHRSTFGFPGHKPLGQTISVFTWPDFY